MPYSVALLSVLLAAWARLVLDPWLGDHSQFTTFFIAVMVTAFLGGFGPGMLATFLGALCAIWLFTTPQGPSDGKGVEYLLGLGLYLFGGMVLSMLCESLRTARRRVEASAHQAIARQRQLEQEMLQRTRAEKLNAQLAAIVQSSEDAILALSLDGRITNWNTGAERLYGHRSDEARGARLEELFQADAAVPLGEMLKRLQQGDSVAPFETNTIRKDGAPVQVSVRVSPVFGPAGKVSGASLIVRDISERKRLEKRLYENEVHYSRLAEAVPGVLFTNRADGHCDYVSQRFYDLCGLPAGSAEGHGWLAAIAPEDRDRVETDWQRAVREGTPYEGVFRFRLADGSLRWFMARSTPMRDEHGNILRWYGACTDIQSQKHVEEQAAFLAKASAALASSLDYETTLASVARLAVPQIADWASVDLLADGGSLRQLAVAHSDPSKEELARTLRRRFPPNLNGPHGIGNVLRTGKSELYPDIEETTLVQSISDPEHQRVLRELGLKSALVVPLSVRNRMLGTITFVTAESDRHYGPDDLALAEELARRAAMAIDSAQLYREVQEANRRKDVFLAMLAHELRNPLAPIRNAVQVMRLLSPRDSKLEWSRDVIERQFSHLARLVDDLLDLSRLMRGMVKLQKKEIELSWVVAHAVEASRPLIDAQHHEFTVSVPTEPIRLHADLTRLTQVLVNLLNNAAKYTDPGGHIVLRAERSGAEVVVRVRDDGRGMAPELLPRVFDLFTQGERTLARSEGGLGIGLTLVKNLVEMHGGRVQAFSAGPGKGSEFVVFLPALPEGLALDKVAAKEEGGAAMAQCQRILVVDDKPDAADSLALLLRVTGHEVRTAYEGAAALKLAQEFKPEIVFLDVGMPGMDGFEVARRIRQEPDLSEVLLVALTGYNQEEDVRHCKEAGFDMHLCKPADLDVLQGLLNSRPPHSVHSVQEPSCT
jgi:PAS domain S-box-containing protein